MLLGPDADTGQARALHVAHVGMQRTSKDGADFAALARHGIDFVQVVDANGAHAMQEAAVAHFSDPPSDDPSAPRPGVNLLNGSAMALDNAFNWRLSNVACNGADSLAYNAYNAFWTASFAWPDYGVLQSGGRDVVAQSIARALSGGPVYTTDAAPAILRPLATRDGRLLMLDAPGQVARDTLLRDPLREAIALKVFGRVTRPGRYRAAVVAAFHVNKTEPRVESVLRAADAEDPKPSREGTAAYRRGTGEAFLLGTKRFALPAGGAEVFTLAPVQHGVAVFGLVDKYVAPAGIVDRVSLLQPGAFQMTLREPGTFAAWLARPPKRVEVDGRALPPTGYRFRDHRARQAALSTVRTGRAGFFPRSPA